jgi:hypothetical protein
MPKPTQILLYLIFISIAVGCSQKTYHDLPAYQYQATDGKPHYNKLEYWAAHPAKWDPSDSLPKQLRQQKNTNKDIDVFFIHPTSLTNMEDPRTNGPVDDPVLQAKTDYSSILYQASAFNEQARIYAPRYRQAHLRTYYSNDSLAAEQTFQLAYEDVKTAFTYYLQHENNNRPFILAAHSQGTTHAAKLLQDFIEGKPLQNKLIAAYIIGLPVPTNYFQTIPICTNPNQTGCVISWRTYKRGTTNEPLLQNETVKAIVVNPLTWDTTSTRAGLKTNPGSVLKNFNRIKRRVTDAQIHQNVLWSIKPKFFGNFLLKTNNYHIGDINLFYLSIRQNVKQRIAAYWKR